MVSGCLDAVSCPWSSCWRLSGDDGGPCVTADGVKSALFRTVFSS